jgi:DNA-binding GntR family transcriptional regulator
VSDERWVPNIALSPMSAHRTAQAAVVDRLRKEIVSGALAPGERLLQADLAKRMQTSTTPVREAMRELAAEGLLSVDPHRGVMVHQPTPEEMLEVYEILSVLEPMSITKTVERITDEEIDEAAALLDSLDDGGDVGDWIDGNRRFHHLLAEASRSPNLTAVMSMLRNRATIFLALSLRSSPEVVRGGAEDHRALLDAIRRRDAAAARKVVERHHGITVELSSQVLDGSVESPAAD